VKVNNWFSTRQRIIILDFADEDAAAEWDRAVGLDPDPDFLGLHLSDDIITGLAVHGRT
jgi:hypothetical protein